MISLGVFAAYIAYEIVTVPLYMRLIYVLIRNGKFNRNPLLRIVSIIGILELCHFLDVVLFYRLPLFGPTAEFFGKMTDPSRVISWAAFVMFFLRYEYIFLHIFVAINRLTAIWVPLKYDQIWKKHWHWMIGFSFLIAFGLPVDRLLSASFYAPMSKEKKDGYTLVPAVYDLYMLNQNLLTAIVCSIGMLLCLLFNGLTLVKMVAFRHSLRGVAQMQTTQLKVETNLFIMAIWMTISLILLGIFQILLYSLPRGSEASFLPMHLLLTCVEEVNCLSQPWVLILTNRPLRKAAFPSVFADSLNLATNLYTKKAIHVAPAAMATKS